MRRILCLLSALLLLTALSHGLCEEMPSVRVWLRRLQITDRVYLTVHGKYVTDDEKLLFDDGSQMIVVLRDDSLVVSFNGLMLDAGKTLKLVRCSDDGWLTINTEQGKYDGDLALDISGGVIRPVLTVALENYTAGVVPYEMGDSFPLKALKAQAVAARNYALGSLDPAKEYDVEDTTNDQAYRGRSVSSPLSEQAVAETAGICGTYKGKTVRCYYTASNGGQTELAAHLWPSEEEDPYGYMEQKDDPYDLENDASTVRRYTLKKKPGTDGVGEAFLQVLSDALREPLQKLGFSSDTDLIRVDEIRNITVGTPKYEGDCRLMTVMTMELKLSVRERKGTTDAAGTPSYGKYQKLTDPLTVELPIFPTVEQSMGLSINLTSNEIVTVVDAGSSWFIESRRFGHGAGMSQRGAEQMARKYKKDYTEILKFYYPGMELTKAEYAAPTPAPYNTEKLATPAPTPTPTPRPTLLPVTEKKLAKGEYFAKVCNISEDSTLNLRASASLSSDIVRRLQKDQTVIVEKVDKNGWALVRTDDVEGYVRTEYLEKKTGSKKK